jgi:hypothetical protein
MCESRLTFIMDDDDDRLTTADPKTTTDLWHSCKKFKGYANDWVQLNQRERLNKLDSKAKELEREIAKELFALETDLNMSCAALELELEVLKVELEALKTA